MTRIERAEAFCRNTRADIRHGGTSAHYSPATDHVQMPPFEAFRDATVKGPWTELKLKTEHSDLEDLAAVMKFIGMVEPERPSTAHVAVVYAIGDIVDGDGDGVLGARQQIASHTLVATLRTLTADPSVKAVVLRVDSAEELDEVVAAAHAARLAVETIADAGRTQLEPGTVTCAAIGPADDDALNAVTGSLRLY